MSNLTSPTPAPSRHALITGGAKRVGRKIALHLAALGYDITLHYHRSKDDADASRTDIEAFGVRCRLLRCDLSDTAAIDAMLADAATLFGDVTLLIHNASLFNKDCMGTVGATTLEQHMQVNCFAPILLSQALYAHAAQHAHIICLSDGMRQWSISPEFMSYSMSKLALEQFVTLAAPAFAPNIRINAIGLGATLPGHMDKPTTFDSIRALSPLQQLSSPEELCQMITTLEKSPAITGQYIALNGGMHLPKVHATKL